jgi:hypothetical protein
MQWRDRPFRPGEREKLVRFERLLRRWVPVFVVVSIPSVWTSWHDEGAAFGIALLGVLVAVELSAGIMLPWVFRRIIRDGDALSDPAG